MTIQDVLNRYNVRYWTTGKNIGKQWLGLKCRWCNDPSHHLGIHIKTGNYICWICGAHGAFWWFLRSLGVQGRMAKEIALELKLGALNGVSDEPHQPNGDLPKILRQFTSPLPQRHRDYLEQRDFDPDLLQRKYGVMASDHIGRYKFRVIIPVEMGGQIVGFTSRDITNRSDLRYLSSSDELNIKPRREWVFNTGSIKRTNGVAVVVEGAFDAMRIGDGAISVFSTQFSKSVLSCIRSLGLRRLFCMFDGEPDATQKAYQLANCMSPFIPEVEVIEMDEGKDPADLTDQEVKSLRREIF